MDHLENTHYLKKSHHLQECEKAVGELLWMSERKIMEDHGNCQKARGGNSFKKLTSYKKKFCYTMVRSYPGILPLVSDKTSRNILR